ncbi:hypothetical protein [Paractinoplanes lichenicola]|uniref:Fibronectin type-III domain-containing protein n=1 Tax=Paractinoplanes lichenicola TaxID=2802976 RepID=A0ABS1VJP4_9ACTN|nr:hypothetical protein [Actinoplanes lichenicola]MBL7254932.1 hypothetical protein [Actinoplanes lichenicola]
MRRGRTTAAVLVVAAGLIAAGSGLSAWANWEIDQTTEAKGSTGRVPAVAQPKAEMADGRPAIEWAQPDVAPSRPVTGYVVVRVHKSGRQVVCTVPAATRTCVDKTPPAGSVSYVVRATASTWTGPDSPASEPLQITLVAAAVAAIPEVEPAVAGKPAAPDLAPAPAAKPPAEPDAKPTPKPVGKPTTTPPAPKEEATTTSPPVSSPAGAESETREPEPSASGSAP